MNVVASQKQLLCYCLHAKVGDHQQDTVLFESGEFKPSIYVRTRAVISSVQEHIGTNDCLFEFVYNGA